MFFSYLFWKSFKMEAPAKILAFAFSSRFAVIILQFVSNVVLPDHDADVFNPPLNTSSFGLIDSAVHKMLGGFRRWDAVYFTHIMQYGYTYENCIAFFPLFPWLVSSMANILQSLKVLHFSSCILLTSVFANFVLFALTSLGLYKLGKNVLKDEDTAYYSTLFFCINPASIFMTAPYSEVLYFCTLIYALNGLNAGAKYAASFLIGLGVFTRSNGLIGTAFILHSIVKSLLVSAHHLYISHQRVKTASFMRKAARSGLKSALEVLVCTILCVTPFFVFQYFTYLKFCKPPTETLEPGISAYGRKRGYHLQGDEPSSWCHNTMPLSYSYIQSQHWGVGFLQYYSWKQIPNFILALPIICLSLRACHYFLNLDHKASVYLGLWDFRALSLHRALMLKKVDSYEYDDDEPSESRANGQPVSGNLENMEVPHSLKQLPSVSDTVVFAINLLSLLIFGLLFVHIQVLTRLLCSSSPLLYWYCGTLYVSLGRAQPGLKNSPAQPLHTLTRLAVAGLNKAGLHFLATLLSSWRHLSRELKCITAFFIAYFIIGTVMFSNFLPWT